MSNDPNEVVKLAAFNTEVEAQLFADELAAADIDAQSSGAIAAGFRIEAPGDVAILVRRSDLQAARQVLEQFRNETAGELPTDDDHQG